MKNPLLRVTLLLIFVAFTQLLFAQTSWKGTVSTSWEDNGNWTNGIPTASMDANIGDANFTGSYQPNVSNPSACKSLTLGGTVTTSLSIDKNITINSDLLINSNASISLGKGTISINGNFINDGSFSTNFNQSSVIFGGTSQVLGGTATTTFRKFTVNAGSELVLKANMAISGGGSSMTVNGILDPGTAPANKVTTGSMTLGTTGTLRVTSTLFSDNYSATPTISSGSIIEYAANANQTINSSISYSTLKISGSGIKSLSSNLSALRSSLTTDGNIVVTAGTLDIGTYTANRGTSSTGGTLSLANGATLRVGGTAALPANFATNNFSLTSTVEYYGTNQSISAQAYGNLNITSSGGSVTKTLPGNPFTVQGNFTSSVGAGTAVAYTAGAAITVNGNFVIGAGTTFNGGSYIHTLAGNLNNSGTLTGNTSTLTMAGAGTVISGSGTFNFYNLTIAASNITASTTSGLTVSGNLATTGDGIFTQATGNLTMSGSGKSISGASISLSNLTVSGTVTTTSDLLITGNLAVSGSFTGTSGTITMPGSSKTISGVGTIGFNGLSLPGSITTASNFSISSALDIAGSFTASAGTATFTNTSTLNGSVNLYNATLNGTSLKLSTNAVLGVSNTFTIAAGALDATTSIPNTVTFNGAGLQTIPAATYYHLVLANGGTKTAGGAIVTNGDFTINTGVTYNGATYTHLLYNNWINNGTFTPATSTISFTGTSDPTITGATTFNGLTVNKTSTGNVVNLLSDVSTTTVTMTNGILQTGTKTLTITGTRSGAGIIIGTIKRQHAFTTGVDYEFESPNNKIRFNSVTGVTSITVTVTAGIISDYPYVSAINREYVISIPAGTYNANLYLHYEDPEVGGNEEATMQLWANSGGSWVAKGKTGNNATTNNVNLDNVTNLAQRWTLASLNNVLQWNGSVSSDWAIAANWTVLQGSPGLIPGPGDVVQIGSNTFTKQPTINTPVTLKNIEFGSAKAATLTLASGGSLTTGGNIRGTWTGNAIHTIDAGAQNLTINGDLILSDGTANHIINVSATNGTITVGGSITQSGSASLNLSGSGTLAIGGNYNYTNGAFSAGNYTVIYNGTLSQKVAGLTYYHLAVNKLTGTATCSTATTITGNATVSSGQLALNGATTISGGVTVNSGAGITAGSNTIYVGGDWLNAGIFTPAGSTVIFNGTGPQSISASTFNKLTITKSSSTATLTGNVAINGDISVTGGTFNLNTYTANRTSLGGTMSAAANTAILISGTNNMPANFSTYSLSGTSTVTYNGTGVQTIGGVSYGNLVLTNGGANAKTLGALVTVTGDLTINSGATLNAGAYTISLNGNWNNNGTFTPATGTVLLNGSSKTVNGNTTFNRVTVYGSYTIAGVNTTYNGLLNVTASGSYTAGNGTAILNGDLINSGTLTSTGSTTFSGTSLQTIRLLNALSSSSTGVVNFNGTVSPVLNSTSTPMFANLNINNTAGVNPSVGWTVLGTFTINSGAAFNGGISTHTIGGNFTNNGAVTSSGILNYVPSGTVTLALGSNFKSTGKVIFGGSGSATITGTPNSLNDVVIANTNTSGITPSSNWTITRNFTINSNALFNGGNNTYTIGGDFESNGKMNGGNATFILTSTAPGKLTASANTYFNHLTITGSIVANSDFKVAGDVTNNGTIDASIGSLVLTGNNDAVIKGSTNPSTIAEITNAKGAAATTTMAVNLTGITTLEINSGTFNTATYTLTEDITGGSLLIDNYGTLKLGGTSGLPSFTNYAIDTLSTVAYAGSSQTISNLFEYGNLSLTTAGTTTPAGPLTVLHDFSLSAGTFAAGSYTHSVGGNWTITGGTYSNTGSTIVFNGKVDQQIATILPFNNITINKAAGKAMLAGHTVINNNLTFTLGKLALNSYNLTLGTSAAITGASAANYIIANSDGALVQRVANGGSKVYPIGNNAAYLPATVTLTSGSTADNFSAKLMDAVYMKGTSGNAVNSGVVNATWLIEEEVSGGSNASITLQWPAALELTNFNRASCREAHFTSGDWDYGLNDLSASGSNPYTITRAGFTSFSPFTVSSFQALPVTWTAVYGANEAAGNHIYWSTAAEYNNSYFVVEASTDGQTFTAAGKVVTTGNSSGVHTYDFVDVHAAAPITYYRIRQVDINGTYTHSKTIKIVATATNNISLPDGNIIANTINITFNSVRSTVAKIGVVDATGKMMISKNFSIHNGNTAIRLDAMPMAAGIYFMNIEMADGMHQTIKLIKK